MEISTDQNPGQGWLNFAQQAEKGVNAQNQMALELKMRSSLMEQEAQKQQQVEQEKYARENMAQPEDLGLLKQFAQKYGVQYTPPSKMNLGEYRDTADLMGKLAMMRSMSVATGTQTINDPNTGLPMQTQRVNTNNPLGQTIPIGPPTEVPDYKNKVEQYNKIATSAQTVAKMYDTYKQLTLTGPVEGHLGAMLGSTGLSSAQADFQRAAAEAGPQTAAALEGVPGGRYSMGLSQQVSKGLFNQSTPAQTVEDTTKNILYQHYTQLRRLGANPPAFLEQFAQQEGIANDPKTSMPQDGYFFDSKFVPYSLHDSIAGSIQANANPAQQTEPSDPYHGLTTQEKVNLLTERLANRSKVSKTSGK